MTFCAGLSIKIQSYWLFYAEELKGRDTGDSTFLY